MIVSRHVRKHNENSRDEIDLWLFWFFIYVLQIQKTYILKV